MSFLNSVKRALGFPDEFDGEDDELDDDELDDELIDDPDTVLSDDAIDLSDSPAEKSEQLSTEELKTLAADLFDSTLAYFNSHQPELVQRCIDLDAQRTLIIDNLEAGLRDRFSALAERACRNGERMWADKQQRMGAELNRLKSEFNAMRQQREEFQSAQLSATRQKRAMTDRINDLENQVTNLEAEREQLQLENQSMASRLRVVADAETKQPDTAAELATLRQTNKKLTDQAASLKESHEEACRQIKRLTAQLDEASAANVGGITAERIAELEEIESNVDTLRKLKDESEARVIELTRETKKTDATIAQLQKQLADSAKASEEARLEIDRLQSASEAAQRRHQADLDELHAEIRTLKETLSSRPAPDAEQAEAPAAAAKPKRRKKRKKRNADSATLQFADETDKQSTVRISAIDELMDNTDWFVAPDPVPLKKDPEVEENFGYKEPAKKTDAPDDDRQLTLW